MQCPGVLPGEATSYNRVMSTVLPPPPPPTQAPINPALQDSERYIDEHIGRTRRALKLADFAAGLITLVAGGLAFLLVAGLIDHWIVPGGLEAPGRLALFLVFIAGVAWHAWRRFVPLLRSISPVYAAHTIEQASPSLKNSLLNVLLFRTHRHGVPAKVYHAMEQQAAARLSAAPTDGAIDRATLLKLGYALLAIVAACAIYAVFSPKNLATSAGRILAPWADIAAPSRVQILNVQPGDGTVARGERVAISADVLSVRDDETVRLRYSTADEQLVDETIVMTRPAGGAKFTADLPRATDAGRTAGVTGDLEYWIEAGDARSRRFKLGVFDRPTIVVQRVHYQTPAYTGEPSRTVENNGDLRGLEGTVVSIEALANQPIRAASVDFDADGSGDIKMTADGERATASFTLQLKPDRRTPLHGSYVLRYTTSEGRGNVEPTQYSIEVTPDYAPEVSITRPEEAAHSARVDEIVRISVEARDPDYAVRQVRLVGRVGERDVVLGELLTKNHTGRFIGGKPFVPGDEGLKAGDVLEYWAEARDNRRPEANLGMSEHRRLTIVGDDAAGGQQQQNNQGGGRNPNEGQGGGNEGGNNANDGEAASAAGESQGGESGESGGESGEGQSGGGAAGGESQEGASDEAAEGQGAAGGQSGEAGEQSGEDGEQQGAGGENSGEQSDGENSGQGGQSSNGENSDDGEAASAAGGAQQQGGDQTSDQQTGEPSGNNPGGGAPQGGQQERVASDGSDDASAMERIREHLANQDNAAGEQSGDASEQQGDDGESAQELGHESPASDAPQDGESQQDGEAASATGAEQQGAQAGEGAQQPQGGAAGRPPEGARPPDRSGAAGAPNNEQGADNPSAGELADGQPGEGEAPTDQGAAGANGSQQRPGENPGTGEGAGETPAGADGALNENNGQSAEGDDAAGQPGAPGASTKRDREGASEGDEGASVNEGDASTDDARGDDESNKRGDQGGDRAGAGESGGGQQADNAGQGEAGSHTASDTGGGASADQGAGETGTGAGDEQLAEGQTGQSSGDQPGAGSETGDAEGGDSESGETQDDEAASAAGGQAGGQSAEGENQSEQQAEGAEQPEGSSGSQAGGSEPGQQSETNADQQPQDENSTGAAGGTRPVGGGTGGSASEGTLEGTEPGGDAANLDFARQQTDLVLDRLEEQVARQQVDPELLKRLGWTEDELRRFMSRWQDLKDRASGESDDAADAQDELNAALRSLGLRREGPTRFKSSAKNDEERDLNDAYRARPPLEYMDWVRAYTKGLSSSEDDGDSKDD
jgi:collagen type III alpha